VKVLESLGRKWIFIIFLSIVIPVGFLVSFRLTGTLPEPQTPISILVEAVSCSIERPFRSINPIDFVVSLYENENISIIYEINRFGYTEKHSHYGGRDCLGFILNVNCSVRKGFVERVDIFLKDQNNKTQVELRDHTPTPFSERFINLSVEGWADGFSYSSPDITDPLKSYLKSVGVDQPGGISLSNVFDWILPKPNNQSHQIEVTFELTYWDQASYKKIVAPIILNIIVDDDDSFETARAVDKGHYAAYVDICVDPEDYYKIWLENGETIMAQVAPQTFDLDLHLFDPAQSLAMSSNSTQFGAIEQITYTADKSGWWYIKVELIYAGYDVYSLSLEGV
jgi:hypothetical protein